MEASSICNLFSIGERVSSWVGLSLGEEAQRDTQSSLTEDLIQLCCCLVSLGPFMMKSSCEVQDRLNLQILDRVDFPLLYVILSSLSRLYPHKGLYDKEEYVLLYSWGF